MNAHPTSITRKSIPDQMFAPGPRVGALRARLGGRVGREPDRLAIRGDGWRGTGIMHLQHSGFSALAGVAARVRAYLGHDEQI
jgi:hypothetical protein